jgi:hypothetical protein
MEGPGFRPGALQVGHFSVIKWVTFARSGGSLFGDQWVTFQLSKYSEWRQVVHFSVIKWVTFGLTNIIGTVEDAHLRERLWNAIRGRGAFRRFKDLLARHPQVEEAWFDFKDARLQKRVANWLETHDIEPV